MNFYSLALLICFITPNEVFAKNTDFGSKIQVWTRKSGNYSDGNYISKLNPVYAKFSKLKLKTKKTFDLQYMKVYDFKGISLLSIIKSYSKVPGQDLVLLHFENGVIVPVPLEKNFSTLKKLDIFIARQIKRSKKFSTSFPKISRKHEMFKDPRPLEFNGNKIIVNSPWHPFLPNNANQQTKKKKPSLNQVEVSRDQNFSPWHFVTTLRGIEFVNQKSYNKQFKLKKENKLANFGFEVFRSRCQYCHGIRQVGASLGWDYLDPLPIYKQKQPRHLYNLVKYSYHTGFQRGLIMPKQDNVTQQEMKGLWLWIKLLDEQGIQSYEWKWQR